MTDHDPLCPQHHFVRALGTTPLWCACDLIAKVRADQEAKTLEFCCADTAVDLRAKVMALPDREGTGQVSRAAVLALFDGSSE